MEVTEAQIKEWKVKFGDIFEIEVEDKKAYLKKPDRKVVSMVQSLGEGNVVKGAELLIDACWLGGDEEIRTQDDYFFAAMPLLDGMIEKKVATLKKR